MNGFDDCTQLSAAADRLLARSDELRTLRAFNPGEARKIEGQIEGSEKRFAKFLAETDEIPKLREEAMAALRQFAGARERFNIGPGGQVEALQKKCSEFLAESEEISAQREIVKEALLKFASVRSLLSGETGN